MGFLSWLTADTQQSIANIYSGRPVRTVYLLQPDGEPPIVEPRYEGYGKFGGVDAYVWLGKLNAVSLGHDPKKLSVDDLRLIGVTLAHGTVFRDVQTREIWHIFWDHRLIVPGRYFRGRFDEQIPMLGDSANNLLEKGRFTSIMISDLVQVSYPLKFSFNSAACYEALPASRSCPYQGYFYDLH